MKIHNKQLENFVIKKNKYFILLRVGTHVLFVIGSKISTQSHATVFKSLVSIVPEKGRRKRALIYYYLNNK